jgi:hypothetical protein
MSDNDAATVSAYIIKKQDQKQLIRDRYKMAKDATTSLRESWLEIYLAYHGYVKESVRRRGRANFHYHKLFPQIDVEHRQLNCLLKEQLLVRHRPGGDHEICSKQNE